MAATTDQSLSELARSLTEQTTAALAITAAALCAFGIGFLAGRRE